MHQEKLNKMRREAVNLRLQGQKITEISKATGLSAPTIIAAHKMFKEGGWDAIDSQPRGRSQGQNQRLSQEQLKVLRNLVLSPPPQQVAGATTGLWSMASLEKHLKDDLKQKISPRTLSRYLSEIGLHTENQLKLARDSGLYTHWFESGYAKIVASAKATRSTLLWTHYTSIDQSTLIYTHTPRGKCCWLSGTHSDAIQQLQDFSSRAIQMTGGPVCLILSGLDVFSRTEIAQQLTEQLEQAGEITIHPHPALITTAVNPDTSPADTQSINTTPAHTPDEETEVVKHTTPAVSNKATNSLKNKTQINTSATTKATAQATAQVTSNSAAAELTDTPPLTPNENTPRKPTREKRIKSTMSLTHLQRLEAESIHIMREVVAEADNPVMLYSIGKDSAVMLHLAMKAFYPAKPPFPLLHVDTGWKFQAMYAFRDKMVKDLGLQLITHTNAEGVEQGVNPFTHGSALHTDIMKTEALRQALDKHRFDAAFGGARRDEEKSRAKERIFSFRNEQHRWDPKSQRPELWNLYNTRKQKGESIRVFPLSNWTELDIWQYIHLEGIPIVPLYLSAERPVVMRDGMLIMVDDDRMPMNPGEVPMMRKVRFRTLGCYPLTGAVESEATTLPDIIQEMLLANTSERQGRMIDHDSTASMEKKKQEGYF